MGRRKRSIEKKEKGRKISKSLSLLKKGEFNMLRGENIFETFFSPPPSYHFKKPCSKSFENY
jgi:hypothetical protein